MGLTIKNRNGSKGRFRMYLTPPAPPAPAQSLLLDLYPGAAVAYSLRKLNSSYSGAAIRVRRSNDNAEQDIGFVDNYLDITSLTNFVGANNGFVVTWYDQSGNARNATQTTAANQPQIVSSGSVILDNGKPSILFDGSNDSFGVTLSSVLSQPNSFGIVFKYNNNLDANHDLIDSNPNAERTLIDTSTNNFRLFAGAVASTAIASTTNQTLLFSLFNGSSSQLSINSSNVTGLNPGGDGLNSFNIGLTQSSSTYLSGNIQEIIIYNSNQSTNRTGIESNINSFYSIY